MTPDKKRAILEAAAIGTSLYTADQLTEAYEAGVASLDAEVNDWRSQAHRSQSEADNAIAECDQLRAKLLAEQAKSVGLREALHYSLGAWEYDGISDEHGSIFQEACSRCDAPSDTSALEAIVKKAGEVMRERCAKDCELWESGPVWGHTTAADSIRALPAVTLEDLK